MEASQCAIMEHEQDEKEKKSNGQNISEMQILGQRKGGSRMRVEQKYRLRKKRDGIEGGD